VVGLHLLHLLLELLVAILQLLDLAREHGDRLLQLVQPVLHIDRVAALGCGGRGKCQDREGQQARIEGLHGGHCLIAKQAIFRQERQANKRKRRSFSDRRCRLVRKNPYWRAVMPTRLRAQAPSSEPTTSGRSLP
jgi:hypothetical protein